MFDVVIAAGGKGLRAGTDKLSAYLGEITVLAHTVNAFRNIDGINKIIVATNAEFQSDGIVVSPAGKTRAESVKNGLSMCESEYVMIHDGARPFVTHDIIQKVMADTVQYGSSVPYLPISDSLRLVRNGEVITVDRNDYVSLQTPQGFPLSEILRAISSAANDTTLGYDESELFSKFIRPVHLTAGDETNRKLTTPSDLVGYNLKSGVGYDVHRIEKGGKPFVLGGVRVPFEKGLVAHSDGDALLHAIMDALLGAANERDIGVLFPDNDPSYENADSCKLLLTVKEILKGKNLIVNNISATVMAQRPRLMHYIPLMERRIAEVLDIPSNKVTVSATTTENLGIIGEGNGIACLAIATVI